jgi:protein-S-isoprenylcysteine O-methyltransferase Ste14
MAMITVAGTVAYLALGVIGAGGLGAYLAHTPFIVAALVTIISAIVALFTQGNLSSGEREDRGNRWVLAAFGLLGLLNGWLPAYTDRIDFWTLGGNAVRWVGVIVFIAGTMLRMWPVFVLGNRFSGLVAIQPGHRLVTTGIYGVIRHPSYGGLLMGSLGWSLVFRAGTGVLLTALTLLPVLARIHAEEAMLQSHFGAEYDAYRARTSRLIPGIF